MDAIALAITTALIAFFVACAGVVHWRRGEFIEFRVLGVYLRPSVWILAAGAAAITTVVSAGWAWAR